MEDIKKEIKEESKEKKIENKNEVKIEEKENEIKEELKEEIQSKQEPEKEKNNESTDINDFIAKNQSLIKVINVNLEVKGYSKVDIQSKLNEIFNYSINEKILSKKYIDAITNLLVELIATTIDSDKKDIEKFVSELCEIFQKIIL